MYFAFRVLSTMGANGLAMAGLFSRLMHGVEDESLDLSQAN
jgi:hypothetical protein